jgi:SAM-dependent methyltransferase
MATDGAATGIDYDSGASAYRRGRTLPLDILATWRDAVAALSLPGGGRVLDLGSGTGQFLRPLAEWLDATVVGVEPSAGMRAEAREALVPNSTACLAGRAEALALRDQTIDIAWIGFVTPTVTPVHEVWHFDLRAWTSRARQLRQTDSALRPFTDEEFEAGIASIRNDPAHQQGTITNRFPLNLIALHRT